MSSLQKEPFNVCFCFTDGTGRYYRHPLVAMVSVFENTKYRLRVHFLCDETVSEINKKLFMTIAERYGQEIIFYTVPDFERSVTDNVRACFGKGTLFRLFLPELVREERVLYLDCDVVCTLDIAELFNLDMKDLPAAGVLDIGQHRDRKSRERLQELGYNSAHYINAGVMLWNLEKMRKDYADCKDMTLSSIAGGKLKYPDQDALNAYFQERGLNICILPEKYNFMIGVGDRAYLDLSEYSGKIFHYTRDKPWDAFFPAALQYWKYYGVAFPCRDAFEEMEKIGKSENAHLFNFLLRNRKVRKMVHRAWEVSELGLLKAILKRLFPSRKRKK